MKTYEGHRSGGDCVVMVHSQVLDQKTMQHHPYQYKLPTYVEVINHSPTGFEWGFDGSGPAQLALAILVDSVGRQLATEHYQAFKAAYIADLPKKGWQLEELTIRRWLAQQTSDAT